MRTLIIVAVLLFLSSCAFTSKEKTWQTRHTASQSTEATLKEIDKLSYQILVAKDKLRSKERKRPTENKNNEWHVEQFDREVEKMKNEISSLERSRQSLVKAISPALNANGIPHSLQFQAADTKGSGSYELELKDLSLYEVTNSKKASLDLPYHAKDEIELTLIHRFDVAEKDFFDSQVACEGPFKFKSLFLKSSLDAGEKKFFNWYKKADNQQQKIRLYLNSDSGQCTVSFKNPEGNGFYELKINPEEIHEHRQVSQACSLPDASGGDRLTQHYFTSQYESMTCPEEIESIRTLEDTIDGLNSKVKALLGQDAPKEMIENQDPFMSLDFSKAPKLDRILISYLVFRYDFYGSLLIRLLKYHAGKGAEIKIMVSKVISLDKDKRELLGFAEKYPNVNVHFYKFDGEAFGVKDLISRLHRTLHVKMFLTQSESHPEGNVAVIGGRNIHDGFIFKTKPDLTKYPELVQYGVDESFARWTDFEIEITDSEYVKTLVEHYYTLYDYDHDSYLVRSINQNFKDPNPLNPDFIKNANGPVVRHFMSFPYKDNGALEKYYAALFDSASQSIKISTPYFNLTPTLFSSIERAIERGVAIEVVTRLDLEGDTADIILSDVNKRAVNSFYENIKVFEYTNPADILHSKLVLIDGKVVTVGSVNFNQRSFYHDIENTLIVWNEDFYDKIDSILSDYKKLSREITEKQKTKLWKQVIIKTFEEEL